MQDFGVYIVVGSPAKCRRLYSSHIRPRYSEYARVILNSSMSDWVEDEICFHINTQRLCLVLNNVSTHSFTKESYAYALHNLIHDCGNTDSVVFLCVENIGFVPPSFREKIAGIFVLEDAPIELYMSPMVVHTDLGDMGLFLIPERKK